MVVQEQLRHRRRGQVDNNISSATGDNNNNNNNSNNNNNNGNVDDSFDKKDADVTDHSTTSTTTTSCASKKNLPIHGVGVSSSSGTTTATTTGDCGDPNTNSTITTTTTTTTTVEESISIPPSDSDDKEKDDSPVITWIVTKWAIIRLTGLVYLIAFLGAYYQNRGLMGSQGLHPAGTYFETVLRPKYNSSNSSSWNGFLDHPSIFWWMEITDDRLDTLYLIGITISSIVVFTGQDSMICMFLLWLLYFSVITTATAATSFYNYGWEFQLLETGFLAMLLCNDIIISNNNNNNNRRRYSPPSPIILWLFRWLCFRISMGAGLIKIRGDSCWTNKTCLYYHFETQPIPSPMSFIFHFLPKWSLKHAVDLDLFVQVYTSWFVLLPTYISVLPGRSTQTTRVINQLLLMIVRIGGFIQAGFMINIILSGNFAFLNHLTIIPALACLDDACWPKWVHMLAYSSPHTSLLLGSSGVDNNTNTTKSSSSSQQSDQNKQFSWRNPRIVLDIMILGLIANLSRPVVSNLLQLDGKGQAMNSSYDRFKLVNTYGAFGSVGKARYEPIVSISYDGEKWIELEFPCKPGSVTRRPCFCAPYHYRVDWNIWFIGFKPHSRMLRGRESWLFALLAKILDNNADAYNPNKERPWLDLLDASSATMLRTNYQDKLLIPKYAKVDMYHYQMAAPLWEILPKYLLGNGGGGGGEENKVVWWNRTFEEVLIPPVALDQKRQVLTIVE